MKYCNAEVSSFLRKRGFTLVELLVAMVLGIFLVGGAIQIFVSGKAAYNEMQRLGELQSETRFLSDFILKDLRAAESIRPLSTTLPVTAFEVTRGGAELGDQNCAGGPKGPGSATGTLIVNRYELIVAPDPDEPDETMLTCNALQNDTVPPESYQFDTLIMSNSVTAMTIVAFGKDAVDDPNKRVELPLSDWGAARAVEITLTIGSGASSREFSFLVSLRNSILQDYIGSN